MREFHLVDLRIDIAPTKEVDARVSLLDGGEAFVETKHVHVAVAAQFCGDGDI